MQKNSHLFFDIQYSRLNKGQKQAVDTIEGPVMVVAGPGTGKTSILTLRIANILKKTDTAPRNILALTFTESGVYSMRKKLAAIIDGEAYKVNIYTFHGFCNDVIKNYPEEFPRIISSVAAGDIDQIRIIEEGIESIKLERLRPYGDPTYYVRPIISKIKELKREGVKIADLASIIEKQKKNYGDIPDLYYESGAHKGKMKGKYKDIEKNIEKTEELLKLYEYYEAELHEQKIFDFEDMILEVVQALRSNEDLLLRLQEEYQYVLADEHQDANASQNALLELLSSFHPDPNLFIVGDEKQAIYRFQGASLDNFLYFKNLYPSAKIITLEENYRSTQDILDASHSVIINNRVADESLRKKLKSQQKESEKVAGLAQSIRLYEFPTAEDELHFIAESIRQNIQAGVKPGEIAVLYRDNKDAGPLSTTLRKADVSYSVLSDQDVLSNDDVAKILLLLRAVSNISDTKTLSEALFVDFLGLNPLDVYKLINTSYSKKIPIYEVMRHENVLEELNLESSEAVTKAYEHIIRWSTLSHNMNLVEFFETFLDEAGIVTAMLASPGSVVRLNTLHSFSSEIKKVLESHKEYKLADFLRYIDTLRTYKIRINKAAIDSEGENVSLMTAHKSKGLEFEVVYIIGATDGHWGNRRSKNHFNISLNTNDDEEAAESAAEEEENRHIEDERRLFYVALTRAKKQVNISYFVSGNEGRPELPTQFIAEIDKNMFELGDTAPFAKSSVEMKTLELLPGKGSEGAVGISDAAYLRSLFLNQGLSVTALNNYLRCPWDYFFKNLIRVPSPQEKQQLYGTAVHDALKEFFNKYRVEEDLSKEQFIAIFEGNLRRKPLSQIDHEETLEKGKRALGGYYDTYNPNWPRNVLTEFTISGVFVDLNNETSDRVLLRGVLDKIEIKDDDHVRVVDYKTAMPMSRNEIEGKTKNASGDYKRQLVFYRLLLDRYDDKRYKMDCAMIDFVEPDESGRFKREEFEITQQDTLELEAEIKRVSNEILTLSFWNESCDDRDCESCKLRKLMYVR